MNCQASAVAAFVAALAADGTVHEHSIFGGLLKQQIRLFFGAFLPSRRLAAITTTVIFVASYFGENISEMVASLEPVKPLSLFSYFDSTSAIFTVGLDLADTGLLVGIGALFFVLTLVSFGARNVTTGAWPWQRGRPEEN